jgi:hypothetical protein
LRTPREGTLAFSKGKEAGGEADRCRAGSYDQLQWRKIPKIHTDGERRRKEKELRGGYEEDPEESVNPTTSRNSHEVNQERRDAGIRKYLWTHSKIHKLGDRP